MQNAIDKFKMNLSHRLRNYFVGLVLDIEIKVTVQVEIFCSRSQGLKVQSPRFKGLGISEDVKEVAHLATDSIQFITFGIFYL